MTTDTAPVTPNIDRAVAMFNGQQSMFPEETAAAARDEAKRTLAGRFVVPPFTVLDARQGYWRDRKRSWLALGLKSELGRAGESGSSDFGVNKNPERYRRITTSPHAVSGDLYKKKARREQVLGRILSFAEFMADPGEEPMPLTSVFDPVLCEIAYRWFCPPGGAVLDPFAGGSVRGVVAAILGRSYVGIDLRAEQVTANREQWDTITTDSLDEPEPRWIAHDSRKLPAVHSAPVDFVFTCPPYFDLEVYSDDPADISNAADYGKFLAAYSEIIAHSVAALRPNRFAAIVIGNIRDKRTGLQRDLAGDTVRAFEAAGASYYNDAIIVTPVGTLRLRVVKQFTAGRKMGKHHQQLLVFCKGDPRKAADACGPIEILPGNDAIAEGEEEVML